MKLQFNPKFQACSIDYGDELYRNGIFHFNITKMLEFIKKNTFAFPIEQVLVLEVRSGLKTELDEATIATADIKDPIILGEISPKRFNVIDGNHRLERAFRDGLSTILAYRITPKDHTQFLTSEKAYQAYVSYWNDKLDQ